VAIALKVAASLALLWLATRNLDFRAAFAAIDDVRPLLLLATPLALIGAAGVNALRWRWLLAAHGVSMSAPRAMSLLLVTQFFNSGLPSTLGGDAARVVYAVRDGTNAAEVLVVTALDRFAGYSSVILYTAAVVVFEPYGLAFPPIWRAVVLVLAAGVPTGIVVLLLLNALPRPERWMRFAERESARGLGARLGRALQPFLRVRINVAAIVIAIVGSVPIVVLIGSGLAALNAATCGCNDLDLGRAIMIAGPLVLAVSLPISMAGWGVREVVVVALYGLLGLPPGQGLVTSILYGLAVFASGLPGLPIWLGLRSRREAAARAVSPASRRLPASKNSFDQL